MSLFQQGIFRLASGGSVLWKIECDALTEDDWSTLALMAVERFGRPGALSAVPRGGLPFVAALGPYVDPSGPLWIVDDVLTTGSSIERHRLGLGYNTGRPPLGVVVFARATPPDWVRALFTMSSAGAAPPAARGGCAAVESASAGRGGGALPRSASPAPLREEETT